MRAIRRNKNISVSVVRTWMAVVAGLLAAGCGDDVNPCPFSGGGGSCESAADRMNGSEGLCAGRGVSVSEFEIARECGSWDPEFRDCWIGCVQTATTCEAAWKCEGDPPAGCYCCGRDEDCIGSK